MFDFGYVYSDWLQTGLSDDWGSIPSWLGIFLFTTVSRPALGPIHPPIQWVQGALSLMVKQPGCEADHSPSTFSWYGASLSTGTTLPFIYVDIKYKLIRVKYGIL
jgi:hypothetical protein